MRHLSHPRDGSRNEFAEFLAEDQVAHEHQSGKRSPPHGGFRAFALEYLDCFLHLYRVTLQVFLVWQTTENSRRGADESELRPGFMVKVDGKHQSDPLFPYLQGGFSRGNCDDLDVWHRIPLFLS